MRFDKERFRSMKEQLPEWLLDEDNSENRKQIDEFLAFGEIAKEEYEIQKAILKICKDEAIAEAPDGFFEQLPDQLWQAFQSEKAKQVDIEAPCEETTATPDSQTSEGKSQPEKVVDFVKTRSVQQSTQQSSGRFNNSRAPMLSLFAMAASIVLAIILWPTGSPVDPKMHQELQQFHQQLSINDDLLASEIFLLDQQRMGFAPSSSSGRFVVWGRHITLIYALKEQGKISAFRQGISRLALAANFPRTSDNILWEDTLPQLTAWLELDAARHDAAGLLKAGAWLTNLYLAANRSTQFLDEFQHQLTDIYGELPEEYRDERLKRYWDKLIGIISRPLSKKELKEVKSLSVQLIILLEL